MPVWVKALDSDVAIMSIPLQSMRAREVSQASGDWFGALGDQEHKLEEEDAHVAVLAKGDSVFIPFGHLALWTYFNTDDKASHGKLWLQHVFQKDLTVDALALQEVKLMIAGIMNSAAGRAKPWCDIKAGVETWLASIKVADAP